MLSRTLLRAHVHLHDFDGRSSIATWLTRIAINSALMILRKRTGAAQVSIENAGAPAAEALALIPADRRRAPRRNTRIWSSRRFSDQRFAALRPSIRRALELRALEERSSKEIAESMGLSVPAAKSRMFHARAAVRQSLQAKLSRRSGNTKGPRLSAV